MGRVKQLNAKVLVSALIISGILFAAGFFTGYSINRERLSAVENEMSDVVRSVQNFQLQFLFFDVLGQNATCPILISTLSDINKQSYEIGSKLTSYNSDSEIMDYETYTRVKNEYSRLLTGYWLLATKLRGNCMMNSSTIVYFFNKECAKCDDQGFILTYLKKKYGNSLLIFALDSDLDEPSVSAIKQYFNITEYPTLIINGQVYAGFYPEEELHTILNLSS
jgi:thiol-disulfide isomerase/thioredoxin